MRSMICMLALIPAIYSPAAVALDKATVDMPFSFESHGKVFPASKYDVELSKDHSYLTMVSRTNPAVSIWWLATPAESGPNDTRLSIQFDRIGDMPELHTVRLGSYITPILDANAKAQLRNHLTAQVGR
jgi:hypothetical protein